jgi:hypothetical protein
MDERKCLCHNNYYHLWGNLKGKVYKNNPFTAETLHKEITHLMHFVRINFRKYHNTCSSSTWYTWRQMGVLSSRCYKMWFMSPLTVISNELVNWIHILHKIQISDCTRNKKHGYVNQTNNKLPIRWGTWWRNKYMSYSGHGKGKQTQGGSDDEQQRAGQYRDRVL